MVIPPYWISKLSFHSSIKETGLRWKEQSVCVPGSGGSFLQKIHMGMTPG
ncbi:hypothetical protein KNP414_01099 [Paenibacillus mucilaginosus KNP414]|uniref:Uncharacterized protein n=1 Tax=Paenibacillus mucilaginosus (strain KNP414) TaxID=1036673 RepID=F8FCU5_PAEMK|nr:hypothetical protein KNP414_01099 [Paenibacillus mucilaginosus KNP414]